MVKVIIDFISSRDFIIAIFSILVGVIISKYFQYKADKRDKINNDLKKPKFSFKLFETTISDNMETHIYVGYKNKLSEKRKNLFELPFSIENKGQVPLKDINIFFEQVNTNKTINNDNTHINEVVGVATPFVDEEFVQKKIKTVKDKLFFSSNIKLIPPNTILKDNEYFEAVYTEFTKKISGLVSKDGVKFSITPRVVFSKNIKVSVNIEDCYPFKFEFSLCSLKHQSQLSVLEEAIVICLKNPSEYLKKYVFVILAEIKSENSNEDFPILISSKTSKFIFGTNDSGGYNFSFYDFDEGVVEGAIDAIKSSKNAFLIEVQPINYFVFVTRNINNKL